MIDFKKNIVKVGDMVTTFYTQDFSEDMDRTTLRTGKVVSIRPDEEYRVDWAEIEITIKVLGEDYHIYVYRSGNQILKVQ